jgi:hypothetical protein
LSEFPGKVAGYFEHGGYIIMWGIYGLAEELPAYQGRTLCHASVRNETYWVF